MASKKGKGKGGGKGKSKKEKKPPKMSKKEKKLRKKYGSLQVEDEDGKEVAAVNLRRDEVEWVAENLLEEIRVQRDERIRFQLERDFLNDVMHTYWKKYKCLLTEQEKKVADVNRLSQDADDNKTIKAIEGKHFRYEAQINCTAMDVRDELRRQKLNEMIEQQWQDLALELEQANDLMARNAQKYRQQISETRDQLDDLQKYIDENSGQYNQFVDQLNKEMENSKKLFHLVRRMEMQIKEERWSEFIWKLTRNFEKQFNDIKNYYNDATHSNLSFILTLQDWMNDSIGNKSVLQSQVMEYEYLMADAHEKMPTLKAEYAQHRVKHDFILRTKQAINTTKKEMAILFVDVKRQKWEYRELYGKFNDLTARRNNLRLNVDSLIQKVLEGYDYRFNLPKMEQTTENVCLKYDLEKTRLQSHFKSMESYLATTRPYKVVMDKKDDLLERRRLRAMRISKQSEDLRCSLEARLHSVGLKKRYPVKPSFFGKSNRLDYRPANLVAKRCYPPPKPFVPKEWCPPPDYLTEIKVCPTDSVKAFLAWKKAQKKQEHQERHQHQQQESQPQEAPARGSKEGTKEPQPQPHIQTTAK